MEALAGLLHGFQVFLTPYNLALVVLGIFMGAVVGVLPGLGVANGVAILIPMTFKMPPTSAIILLAAIYWGGLFSGVITSILFNIPGEPWSVATTFDGYPMAKRGQACEALTAAFCSHFVGAVVATLMLTFFAPLVAEFSLRFGPPEIFGLLLLGFTMVTYLAGASKLKAVAMALLGLFLGTVGLDPVTATPRFTFGTITLMDGIGLVPIIMGLFGIAEVLLNLEKGVRQEVFKAQIQGLFPSRQQWKASAAPIARGSVLGFFLGILPGIGAIIPTFLSYALEKRLSKHPERFGTGVIEGVAAPESANNAATGGSMIPLLTLGIPPNVVMAVLLGAFLVHGIQPGPLLVKEHPEIFWGVIASMYIGNVMLVILNVPLIGLWVQLLKVPYGVLFPLILLFCIIGVYTVSANIGDIVTMLIFGVIGYLMKKFDYEPMPLVLAYVLGRMAEESIRQTLLLSRGSAAIFLDRPIAAAFLGAAVAVVLLPIVVPRFQAAIGKLARLGES